MDFKILGPLEVDDGDRSVPLGGARQRGLLALLLLHANEVVSSDRLIEELWGGAEDASKALQVAISRLRKALGPAGPLVTRPPGYELRLERGSLDLDRFEDGARAGREALAAGDARLARARLGDALALWRGPALADLAYEPFARAEASRLDELRASVTEERIAADLELGRHADLVGELQELVTRHPLRERLRRQLMLALYRSGRQADALEVYQDARRALTGELGIEPGRELRELQEAMLRQDPALDHVAEAAGTQAPERGSFVGRERELADLVGLAGRRAGRARSDGAGHGRARDRQEPPGRRADGPGPGAQGARGGRPLLGGGRGARVLALGAVAARLQPRARARGPEGPAGERRRRPGPAAARARRAVRRPATTARSGLRGRALPPVRSGHGVPAQRRRGRAAGADVRRPARRRRAVAAAAAVPGPSDGRRPPPGGVRVPRRRPHAAGGADRRARGAGPGAAHRQDQPRRPGRGRGGHVHRADHAR